MDPPALPSCTPQQTYPDSGKQDKESRNIWCCPFCSLENSVENAFCEMCTTRKIKAQNGDSGESVSKSKRKLSKLKENPTTKKKKVHRVGHSRKKNPCRFFDVSSQSGCRYGSGCHFLHDRLDVRSADPFQQLLLSLGLPVSLKGGTMCTAGNEHVYCQNIFSVPASGDVVGWSVRIKNSTKVAPIR